MKTPCKLEKGLLPNLLVTVSGTASGRGREEDHSRFFFFFFFVFFLFFFEKVFSTFLKKFSIFLYAFFSGFSFRQTAPVQGACGGRAPRSRPKSLPGVEEEGGKTFEKC